MMAYYVRIGINRETASPLDFFRALSVDIKQKCMIKYAI